MVARYDNAAVAILLCVSFFSECPTTLIATSLLSFTSLLSPCARTHNNEAGM